METTFKGAAWQREVQSREENNKTGTALLD